MASKNRVTVTVDEHYHEWGQSAERNIVRAIQLSTPEMVAAAQSAEVRRMSSDLHDSIHELPVVKIGDKIIGGIGASDFKANWYELGTKARRSKGKTAVGKAHKAAGIRSGVKGLHYLRKGLYAGRSSAFHRIGEALRNARP